MKSASVPKNQDVSRSESESISRRTKIDRQDYIVRACIELYPRNVEIVNPFVSLQHLRVRLV